MYGHVIMSIKQTIYVHHYTGMSKGSKVQPKTRTRHVDFQTWNTEKDASMGTFQTHNHVLDPHSAQRTD